MHLGYRYEGSPLIVSDDTPPVPFDPVRYVPSARPGHRAPHAWITPGHSTLDLFVRGFTLLRFGGSGGEALVATAREAGMPLAVADIADDMIAQLYERRLVLVRPDGHVAWRGDAVPPDAAVIVRRVRGG